MPETISASSLPVSAANGRSEETRLRALRRIGQLAGEIQGALKQEDMDLVRQASSLLAPALAQWANMRLPEDACNTKIATLTQEAQQALAACETALTGALSRVRQQQGHVRRHQQRIRQVRSPQRVFAGMASKTLNVRK